MYQLLSNGITNHKIKKNIKKGYLTFSLNLAHSNLSGINVCPKAKKLVQIDPKKKGLADCALSCVGSGGMAAIYNTVLESRIKKTLAFFKDREYFLATLAYEIQKAIKESTKKGLIPSFRLNAYSDILWERFKIKDNKNIFELFPDTIFYDYSKIANRKTPKNYQLTYSHYGNWSETKQAIQNGYNVAMVFEKVPAEISINGYILQVVDGDISDLRVDEKINGQEVIVGLKFKAPPATKKAELIEGIKNKFVIPEYVPNVTRANFIC